MSDLCKSCSKKRWYPKSIDKIQTALSKRITTGKGIINVDQFRKNIAYNVQYLEYLNKTLQELNLSSVLITQTYKTFVITGVSIIEAIFYFMIKESGLQKQTNWKSVKKVSTPEFQSDDKTFKIENEIFEKLELPHEEEMTFDSMIKKVESKKLLGLGHSVYGELKYLRQLRNKIHIHSIEGSMDTDYWNFNKKDVALTKKILHELLTSSSFCALPHMVELYEFLSDKDEE